MVHKELLKILREKQKAITKKRFKKYISQAFNQANQKTANLENTESKEDKQDSLNVDLRDLEVLSLKGISKGENIQIYNQDFITKALAHQMNLDNNRLFYIESPFFNSREVENTKEKVA